MTSAIILPALVAGAAALAASRSKVAGTTLVATWWWGLAAFGAACGLELLFAWRLIADDNAGQALRYAARMLLLCPTISLLGVKRPQDGPWNFVVTSLWGVLALPAAEALFLNTGQPLEISGFRSWFVLVLLSASLVNTLPTRHWPAALAATGGQCVLLGRYLPLPVPQFPFDTEAGLGLLALAAALYALRPPRRSSNSLDQLWFDFRDSFGLFWGLRVQERIQASAKMYDWPVALHWSGWKAADGKPVQNLNDIPRQEITTTFRGLLRRFVSNDWIDARLSE
jgi:hypothetical protein